MFQPIFNFFRHKADYKPVDLSKTNLDRLGINPQDHDELSNYLNQIKKSLNTKVLYGGYLEERSLYNNKSLFNSDHKQRNIHIGADFWADAGQDIVAPLDGIVHSFADNEGFGNYGPCIILKHQDQQNTFYSLYGHLSKKSLDSIRTGQIIKRNHKFCRLGKPGENGGYVPHLHFQLIKNMGDYKGDYPGVCHLSDLEFYKNNTINPVDFLEL